MPSAKRAVKRGLSPSGSLERSGPKRTQSLPAASLPAAAQRTTWPQKRWWISIADAEPPAPGGVGADPQDLAQPVRLGRDDGPRATGVGALDRGQRGGTRLGPAGQGPRQPGQARPDGPAQIGGGSRAASIGHDSTAAAAGMIDRTGSQTRVRRVNGCRIERDGRRVEHRQELAHRVHAQNRRRPGPRSGGQDQRAPTPRDERFQSRPGLTRHDRGLDVAHEDGVVRAQRVGLTGSRGRR